MATQETYYQSVFPNEVKSIMYVSMGVVIHEWAWLLHYRYVAGDIKTPSAESALIIENTVLKHIRDIVSELASYK